MNRAFFYPAGRERTDAIGALDLALWDIKGKVQGCPSISYWKAWFVTMSSAITPPASFRV
jgi:hypothetical protein